MLATPTPAPIAPVVPTQASLTPLRVFAIDAQRSSARPAPRIRVRRRALNVLDGHATSVTGVLRPRVRGAKVVLDLLHGRRWTPVAHTRTGARGRFHLRYVPRALGSWDAQLHVAGSRRVHETTRHLGRLSSYTATIASWYGGGGQTACGSYLTSATMGVANKTLPCGTLVTIRYGGRTVTVPVIDRGPYVAGREFDLTEATKRALGFEGVGEVWATR